jgi:hypothetical protein
MDERGRYSEMEPVEYAGDPLRRLVPRNFALLDEYAPPPPDEYCNICENFPCLGNHPANEDARG